MIQGPVSNNQTPIKLQENKYNKINYGIQEFPVPVNIGYLDTPGTVYRKSRRPYLQKIKLQKYKLQTDKTDR